MIKERIEKLSALFLDNQIDGYIVPAGDEYLSEYTADYAKRLEYITGFTGSNGIAIIFKNCAFFFTDGRYLEQSAKQLDKEIFQIYDLKALENILQQQLGKILGYDPKLFTLKQLNNFSSFTLKSIENNLITKIWGNPPVKPAGDIWAYPEEFTGISHFDKIDNCRDYLKKHNAKYLLLTKADSICWLLNIRGNDIPFSPMVLGVVVMSLDKVYLFTTNRSHEGVKERAEIHFYPEEELANFLSNIKDKILIDEENTNSFILSLIKNKEQAVDPCILLKACKNEIEIKGFIKGHIYDAIALCEFFSSLYASNLENLTEYDLVKKLSTIRAKQPLYIMDSFPTICGFQGNGSIIHYNPASNTNVRKIKGDGLLLIDSGAHYMGATTDITRVIVIGDPTNEQKNRYTQVLKGHVALAKVKFPKGVTGSNLDILARQFLWEEYEDYAHGTGHGVGSALSVHEGPQNINLRSNIPLQQGMILSNEPGFYKAGSYGIRIENLMYVDATENPNYLQFKTLSLIPYEKKLINFDFLTALELNYIRNYYQNIHENIYNLLSKEAQKWLVEQLEI